MTKWIVGVLAVGLVAASICIALTIHSPRPRGPIADENGRLSLVPGLGRVSGIVVDDDDLLPEGATPHTYEGASIHIYRAVEAGTYKTGGDDPAHINYAMGERVAELESDKHGTWRVDLVPGKYFAQAFYGDSSYSENLLVDVEEAAIVHLRLELLHGV